YYIHGYLSSPDGDKGILFREQLHAKAIKYRDCEPEDLVISDCLKRIADVIKNDGNVVLIGSSLGGFLAASTAIDHSNVKKLILLNPAIIPPSTNLDNHVGIPRRILEDMVDNRFFENKLGIKITILRGTEDEFVPDSWVIKFAKAQEATIMFLHDDHRFSRNLTKLPIIISNIIEKIGF
ncbi:MAG: alpha/beta fold hydrolase, partial [Thermoplasmatales archaeon]